MEENKSGCFLYIVYCSYNGRPIGSRTRPFDWYSFNDLEWPWTTVTFFFRSSQFWSEWRLTMAKR